MFILFVVFVFLRPVLAVRETKQGYRALSFGRTTGDYIQFYPGDMSPFASSFTMCTWMKRQPSEGRPMVFHYYTRRGDDIYLGADGYWNGVSHSYVNLNLRGRFPDRDVWFHYCLSWAAGGTQSVYINGAQVGSISADSSHLTLGGTICLGNGVGYVNALNFIFGGELYKLNLFSEQLSSSQIKEMADSGMCSTVEEKYETRQLKWEQLLTKQRHGNVTDLDMRSREIECARNSISELETRLTEVETELKTCGKTQRRLNRKVEKCERKYLSLLEHLTEHYETQEVDEE